MLIWEALACGSRRAYWDSPRHLAISQLGLFTQYTFMSCLFSPVSLGNLSLDNRVVVPPMCTYSATEGIAAAWHAMHYGQLAVSGAGLVIIEATAVEPEGRITSGDLILNSDKTEAALGQVIREIRTYSKTPFALQIAHAGRKASCHLPWEGAAQAALNLGGWGTFSSSALPYDDTERPPTALDDVGLARVKQAFAQAAQRAATIGIDVIEIHGAHGYLLHQFLSPLSNQRQDKYGGSLENRLRFPLEVFEAVRAAFPSGKPVGIRISATDLVEGGWDLEQSLVFCRELQSRGCAFIHVSSAGLSPLQKLVVGPGFQVPYAERIKQALTIPVITVGLITEPEQAEAIVAEGQADLVALGRTMLYNPRWPWHAAAKLGAQVQVPPQYWRSLPHGLRKS